MKLLSLFVFFVTQTALAEPRTVEHVDLNKYLGIWYEIASIPQSFSKGCHCTRAKYDKDGEDISVLNSCNRGSVTGKLTTAKGRAKVVDENTNSKLKVSFFWPFYGDYWIIGLDKDYKYAVVSNRDASSLWILSRTPSLDQNLLNEAIGIARSNGVDTSKLEFNTQTGCTYPAVDGQAI